MAIQRRPFAYRNYLQEGRQYAYQAARGRYPVAIGGLSWSVQSVIQAAALSVRVLFRRKIGFRSFDFALVYASFLWVRTFLFGERIQSLFRSVPEGVEGNRFWLFIQEFGQLIWDIMGLGIGEGSSLIYGYSFIILILGLIHFIQAIRRNRKRKKWYTYHRGESVFFDWLEGAPLVENFKITSTAIVMVIEPVFIILLGYMIIAIIEQPMFGLCVMLSGIALFIEEYSVYRSEMSVLFDQLDAQYVAEKLQTDLKKYDQNAEVEETLTTVQGYGAAIASPDDIEVMREFIKKQNNRSHIKGAKI